MTTRSITSNRYLLLTSVKFAALVGVATVAPFLGNQFLTGPLVNATLFISVLSVGLRGAVMVALIPSLIALSTGLLPAVMSLMVLFIMAGNVILVITFDRLKQTYWPAVIWGSLLKFSFLFASGSIVANMIISDQLAVKAVAMMSWPQLVTALAGGLIARLLTKR